MGKRYYWLKLPGDWFQQKSIKKLRKIAGGDTYTIIYLKMLLTAIKQDGKIFFEGVEENFAEELALEIDEEPENVKIALSYLFAQHLVELVETDEYLLPEAARLTGSESASAERMRRLRERKASQCDIEVTQRLRLGDVEIEKEIEKEIDIYKTSCPELGSGLQQTTEDLTVNNGVEGIDAAVGIGVEGIDTRADAEELGMETEKHHSPEVFIQLPLNDGSFYDVTVEYVEEKKSIYPAVNVEQAFRSMRGWLQDNPRNRKTRTGIKRFMNGWLAKEQNRAPRERNDQLSVQNRFNNFPARKYDYDKLEKDLYKAQIEGTKE